MVSAFYLLNHLLANMKVYKNHKIKTCQVNSICLVHNHSGFEFQIPTTDVCKVGPIIRFNPVEFWVRIDPKSDQLWAEFHSPTRNHDDFVNPSFFNPPKKT